MEINKQDVVFMFFESILWRYVVDLRKATKMLNLDIDPDCCQKGPGVGGERWRFDPEEEKRKGMPRRAFEPIEVPAHLEWQGANWSPTEAVEILERHIPGELLDVGNTLEYSAIFVKAINERQEEIFKIIRSGLKNYEFEFETDEEFRDFCSQRVIRLKIHGDNIGHYYLVDGDEDLLICRIDETINVPTFKNPWENEQ